jgi:prepilin-type N-terminal cleavage/methylation domain-containing protein
MNKKAFTLVELAIVIVIIGLLVGGVLQGQELIQQAKVRSLAKQIEGYRAAVVIFTDKYKYPPGDQPDAFRFWGEKAGCTDDMVTTSNPGGCNGNANRSVDYAGWPMELYRAWQYLALANLIKGSYTGVTGPKSIRHGNPDNSPTAPFGNVIFTFMAESPTGHSWTNGTFMKEAFSIGVMQQTSTGSADTQGDTGPFMTPVDAFSFDTKFDDGMPGTGTIRSKAFQSRCVNGGFNALVNIYDPSKTAVGCSFNIEI